MQAIRNKLKTQKGASITFALLLFLVCAVISSVVIVAATTAAGRMSQLPQMDQRYYAVTSAANLLKNEIDGKTIKIAMDSAADNEDMLTEASRAVAEKKTLEDKKFIVASDFGKSEGLNIAINCLIEKKLENGLLEFDISNCKDDIGTLGDKKYTLKVVFSSNVRESLAESATEVSWKFHSMKRIT